MNRYADEVVTIRRGREVWLQNQLDQYDRVFLLTSIDFWNEFHEIIEQEVRSQHSIIVTNFDIHNDQVAQRILKLSEIENIISLYLCYQFTNKLIVCDFEHIREYKRVLHFEGWHGLSRREIVEETILRS